MMKNAEEKKLDKQTVLFIITLLIAALVPAYQNRIFILGLLGISF